MNVFFYVSADYTAGVFRKILAIHRVGAHFEKFSFCAVGLGRWIYNGGASSFVTYWSCHKDLIVVCDWWLVDSHFAFCPKILARWLGPMNDILSFCECSLSSLYTNKWWQHLNLNYYNWIYWNILCIILVALHALSLGAIWEILIPPTMWILSWKFHTCPNSSFRIFQKHEIDISGSYFWISLTPHS